jgi:hypothetical protein
VVVRYNQTFCDEERSKSSYNSDTDLVTYIYSLDVNQTVDASAHTNYLIYLLKSVFAAEPAG